MRMNTHLLSCEGLQLVVRALSILDEKQVFKSEMLCLLARSTTDLSSYWVFTSCWCPIILVRKLFVVRPILGGAELEL